MIRLPTMNEAIALLRRRTKRIPVAGLINLNVVLRETVQRLAA